MKIAMVSVHAASTAAAGRGLPRDTHIAELSSALSRFGHEVTVFARRDGPDLAAYADAAAGYRVRHVPAGPAQPLSDDEMLPHMGEFARHLDRIWGTDRPDIVHAHSSMSGVATQLAARHHDLPAVQTCHAWKDHVGDDTNSADRLKLEAMVARCATWAIATCTDEMFGLIRLGRPRSQTSVVPCGVDVDLFHPEGAIFGRGSMHRIVSVGKFAPHSGFDVAISALPSIPNAELLIVGELGDTSFGIDPEVLRLRELAHRLGVGHRVTMTGPVSRSDLAAVLRSADVVACTPWVEPCGVVAVEAMACGVPVVASAVGALVDTVVDDVTGRLIPPRHSHRVGEAVNVLLREEFLRRSLGAAGRDRARSRYTWERIAADTVRIYDRIRPAGYRRPATSAVSRARLSGSTGQSPGPTQSGARQLT